MNLYIDLDGTLAEWRLDGERYLYNKGYFLSLAPNSELIQLVDHLHKLPEVNITILSCYLADSAYARIEKELWIKKHLPKGVNAILVPYGISKAEYVEQIENRGLTSSDVLIDDHTPNCLEWKVAGGTSIKFLNGINGIGKTWQGTRLTAEGLAELFK